MTTKTTAPKVQNQTPYFQVQTVSTSYGTIEVERLVHGANAQLVGTTRRTHSHNPQAALDLLLFALQILAENQPTGGYNNR